MLQYTPLSVLCNCNESNFQAINNFSSSHPPQKLVKHIGIRPETPPIPRMLYEKKFAKPDFSVPWLICVLKIKTIFLESTFSSFCKRPGILDVPISDYKSFLAEEGTWKDPDWFPVH